MAHLFIVWGYHPNEAPIERHVAYLLKEDLERRGHKVEVPVRIPYDKTPIKTMEDLASGKVTIEQLFNRAHKRGGKEDKAYEKRLGKAGVDLSTYLNFVRHDPVDLEAPLFLREILEKHKGAYIIDIHSFSAPGIVEELLKKQPIRIKVEVNNSGVYTRGISVNTRHTASMPREMQQRCLILEWPSIGREATPKMKMTKKILNAMRNKDRGYNERYFWEGSGGPHLRYFDYVADLKATRKTNFFSRILVAKVGNVVHREIRKKEGPAAEMKRMVHLKRPLEERTRTESGKTKKSRLAWFPRFRRKG
ncbi:MAG: hypothetical protein V1494_04955 [Candidatus Diapherotrites archaeon]